ncbi:MAG: hypothetical protein IT336_06755 [Thermomicrobiales bacterium]|nr:hypothetical protein [Thermomicrobiales bacterium]
MDRREGGRPPFSSRWWLAALVVMISLPLGITTARQAIFDRQSPATGHAQVVTQGISELPEGEVVWRVVERTARTREDARPGRRVLGFVLATDEPVLLTNVTEDGNKDVARLAPGEAFLVEQGTRQIRASMGDRPTAYLAVELVPAADADNAGDGQILFTSQPFTAPAGSRDIDLVRNVLQVGESALVPDTGESVAILATEGAIDILPSGGRGRTLEAGESAIFEPGELEIEAIGPSATTANGVRALTSSLQDGSIDSAAYVIAVIGPEIPPAPTVEAPTVTPQPTAEPTQAAQTGSITATVYNCPEGMTLENLFGEACELATNGYDFVLSGPGGDRSLADASDFDSAWLWSGLPLGEYYLAETVLPDGYVSYFIPGSAAVGGSPETGYSVTIDPSAPDIGLTVFNLRPEPEVGSTQVHLYLCPSGNVPNDYSQESCYLATSGYSIGLVRPSTGDQYGGNQANDYGGIIEWQNLPLDAYDIYLYELPSGWASCLSLWDDQTYGTQQPIPVQIGGYAPPQILVPLYCFLPVIT